MNKKGEFNVPLGSKKQVNSYDLQNIQAVAKCLDRAQILNTDFEAACKGAQVNDFVFFDSPYWGTFDTYQAGGFSKEAHERLAALYKDLSNKGVYCMLTNSNTDFIKELYSDYHIDIVQVGRNINRDASKRTGEEIIVVNYDTIKEGEKYGGK